MANLNTDLLSPEQAIEATVAAYNSKDAIEKINGLQSSARKIDDSVAKKQIVLPKALISNGENIFIPTSLSGITSADISKMTYNSLPTIFGSGSVDIVETVVGDNVYMILAIPPRTMMDNDFYNILLWADNYSNFGNIEIQFGTDTNFYNYYGKTLKTLMNTKPSEWNNISFRFSDMTKTGTINVDTTINYIRVIFYGVASKLVNCKFGGIRKAMKPRTAITFSFDDINQTDYTVAYEKLKSVGFNAISYVISEEVGTVVGDGTLPRLTMAQMQEMHSNGWYFGIHGKDYFNWVTESTLAEAEVRIKDCKKWLYNNGFLGDGIKHCAYPHGEYNDNIITLLKKYGIKYARTTNLWSQLSPVEDIYKLKLGIALVEDLQTNINELERLVAKGGLINIYAHELYGTKATNFNLFIDYINTNYRKYVTTIPEWCDDYETGTII